MAPSLQNQMACTFCIPPRTMLVWLSSSGLNSQVLASNNEMVILPVNEPTFGTPRKSQIQTYLEQNEVHCNWVVNPHLTWGAECPLCSCMLARGLARCPRQCLWVAGSRAAAPCIEDERCRGHAAEDAAGVGVWRLRLHATPGQELLPVSFRAWDLVLRPLG